MEVRCKICGTTSHINKAHKDYQFLAKRSGFPYICDVCSARIQFEMQRKQEFRKK